MAIFSIQRLSQLTDHDPSGAVAERLAGELARLGSSELSYHERSVGLVDACLKAFDHWRSKVGIDMVVSSLRSHNRQHDQTADLLGRRISSPVVCGRYSGPWTQVDEAWVKWWTTEGADTIWSESDGKWVSDRKWLRCEEKLLAGQVIWDSEELSFRIYESAALAKLVRWRLEVERTTGIWGPLWLLATIGFWVSLRHSRRRPSR